MPRLSSLFVSVSAACGGVNFDSQEIMACSSDDPLDALTFELKELEIQRTDRKVPLGIFAKAMIAGGQPYIARITDGSTACASGLKSGDFVLMVNGRRVDNKVQMVDEVSRGGDNVPMVIARRRTNPVDPLNLKPPGNTPRRLQFLYHICRLNPRRPATGLTLSTTDNFVTVTSVDPHGSGMTAGVQKHDRLLAVNSEEIRDLKQCEELLKAAEGKFTDVHIERPVEAVTPESLSDENPSFVLQRLSIIRGQASAGVPEATPELKPMLASRLENIMKNIRNRCQVKPNTKSPSGCPKSDPDAGTSP